MTYEEIYKKYRRRIESFCQYKLGTADVQIAEDLCSEVFLLLYEKWETLGTHEEGRVLKWLYNAALIKTRAYHRIEATAPRVYSLEEQGELAAQGEELLYRDGEAEDELYSQYLAQIKDTLTQKDRITFELKVEKHYTIKEIAKELHANEVTIKVRWYRIQQKLKEKIQDFLK